MKFVIIITAAGNENYFLVFFAFSLINTQLAINIYSVNKFENSLYIKAFKS